MALITIWGDESCQNAHKHMVLGTIWENPNYAASLERDVNKLRDEFDFRKEFHWTEVKGHQRMVYKSLIDIFERYMRQGVIRFRALVVDMSNKRNIRRGDDKELHFYKMFFWLIVKKLKRENRYDIFLDRKSNSVFGRLTDLEFSLNSRMIEDDIIHYFFDPVVRRVEPRSGEEIQLQLADIFAGAIAYVVNGFYDEAKKNNSKNAKVDLVDHIENRVGVKLNSSHWITESPEFNIWYFKR
jgi:hypothetical protein